MKKLVLILVVAASVLTSCQVTGGPDSVNEKYSQYNNKIENAHEFKGMSEQDYNSCLDLLKSGDYKSLDRVLRNY